MSLENIKNNNMAKYKRLMMIYLFSVLVIFNIFMLYESDIKKLSWIKHKAQITKIVNKPYKKIFDKEHNSYHIPQIIEFKYQDKGKFHEGKLESKVYYQNENKEIKNKDVVLYDYSTSNSEIFIKVIQNPENKNEYEKYSNPFDFLLVINIMFFIVALIFLKGNLLIKNIKFYKSDSEKFINNKFVTKNDVINSKSTSTTFINFTPVIKNEFLILKPKCKRVCVIGILLYVLMAFIISQNINDSYDVIDIINIVIGIILISYTFFVNSNDKVFDKNLNIYYERNKKVKLNDMTSVSHVEILYVYVNFFGSIVSHTLNLNLLLNDDKRILIKTYGHKEIDKAKDLAKVIGDFLNIDVIENNYIHECKK